MSNSDFVDTIESIYAASVEPEGWDSTIARITRLLKARGGLLIAVDPGRIRPVVHGVAELPDGAMAEYQSEWAARDPRMRRLLSAPPRTIFADPMFMSEREMDRDPYYAWLATWGFRYATGSQLHRAERLASFFSVQYAPDQGALNIDSVEAYSRLSPHLARAVAINARLASAEVGQASFTTTLDALASPVLLVDRAMRVVFANEAAEALLAKGPLRSSSPGGLVGPDADSTRQLRGIVAHALALGGRAASEAPGVASVPRQPPLPPVAVSAIPLMSPRPGTPRGAVAALFVSDPLNAARQGLPVLLRAVYPLSIAESEIVAGLANGDSVEGLALKRGSVPGTIITQIKSALRKTGAENRAELIRLALVLAVPLRT